MTHSNFNLNCSQWICLNMLFGWLNQFNLNLMNFSEIKFNYLLIQKFVKYQQTQNHLKNLLLYIYVLIYYLIIEINKATFQWNKIQCFNLHLYSKALKVSSLKVFTFCCFFINVFYDKFCLIPLNSLKRFHLRIIYLKIHIHNERRNIK